MTREFSTENKNYIQSLENTLTENNWEPQSLKDCDDNIISFWEKRSGNYIKQLKIVDEGQDWVPGVWFAGPVWSGNDSISYFEEQSKDFITT